MTANPVAACSSDEYIDKILSSHVWNHTYEMCLGWTIIVNIKTTVCWILIPTFDTSNTEIISFAIICLNVPGSQYRKTSYCLVLDVAPVHWSRLIISDNGAGNVISGIFSDCLFVDSINEKRILNSLGWNTSGFARLFPVPYTWLMCVCVFVCVMRC